MLGTTQSLIVCMATPGTTVSPCGADKSPQVITAYVLDTSSEPVLNGLTAPVDYSLSMEFWGLAFSTVFTVWLLAFAGTKVISVLKRI